MASAQYTCLFKQDLGTQTVIVWISQTTNMQKIEVLPLKQA
jgi:hypothetical protein